MSELRLDGDNPTWTSPATRTVEGRSWKAALECREQIVPLSPQAAALFREALSVKSRDEKSEFVFPAHVGTVKIGKAPRLPHIHGESVTMAMRRLRELVGVDNISIHDMRRAISNWMKDEGMSREVRDLAPNHTDPSVTEAHYSQGARMERQVRAALEAWAAHVWQITGQSVTTSNVITMKA